MNRRGFLKFLGMGAAVSTVTHFLPPIGGWHSDAIAHAPLPAIIEDVFCPEGMAFYMDSVNYYSSLPWASGVIYNLGVGKNLKFEGEEYSRVKIDKRPVEEIPEVWSLKRFLRLFGGYEYPSEGLKRA